MLTLMMHLIQSIYVKIPIKWPSHNNPAVRAKNHFEWDYGHTENSKRQAIFPGLLYISRRINASLRLGYQQAICNRL
jgi:hypothetical protein